MNKLLVDLELSNREDANEILKKLCKIYQNESEHADRDKHIIVPK